MKKNQGGGVSKGISDSVLETVWRHIASVTFKMASTRKVFFEETDENFEFLTDILFRFLKFDDAKIPTCHRRPVFGPFFSDETSSGVMHFKEVLSIVSKSSEQSYRRSHSWGPVDIKIQKFRHSNRRFIKGYTRLQLSKFSSALQSHWIPISIPSKFTSCTSNYVNAHKQTTQESKVTRKTLSPKVSRGC